MATTPIDPACLRALREKYVEIRALRVSSKAGDPADPRPRMRRLARRFPGALRELDELPPEVIDARIAVLDDALAHRSDVPGWVETLVAYHGWMRVALRLKRELAHDAHNLAAAARWARAFRPGPGEPSSEALVGAVEAILHPPGGRLSRWVFGYLAAQGDRTPRELEEDAFPPSPQRHAAGCSAPSDDSD